MYYRNADQLQNKLDELRAQSVILDASQKFCWRIICDFNYKDINWEDLTTIHSEIQPEYTFIECLRDNYLLQHIRHFTRCRN